MKTIKENKKVSTVTTHNIEVETYITNDGRKFDKYEDALKHEQWLDERKRLNDKYRIKEIEPENYGINSSYISCKTWYIDELNEETIKDLKKEYPYFTYDKSKIKNIKKGCNIIIEEEWESNSLGRWSGYEIHIYHPEEIITEKKEQIEKLEKLMEKNEIKCYTCKYRDLNPVPEDLPCVDCWNEMYYVNYEKEEN